MNRRTVLLLIHSIITLVIICAACQQVVQDTNISTESDNMKPVALKSMESSASADIAETTVADNTDHAVEPTEQAVIPAEDEDNCATAITDRVKSFFNLAELDAEADIVFTGVCISAESVFQNDTLYTLSEIKIDKVFKGDMTIGSVVLIAEFGGRVTHSEYTIGCNLPPPKYEQDGLSADQEFCLGIDWYYPLKQGEKVLLFAIDSSGFLEEIDEPLYAVIGDYNGKLFLQEDGSYAKPLPSETDEHIFGEGSLVITIEELNRQYK